jgi:hypothetical protein
MKVIEFWDVITFSLREKFPVFPKNLLPKSSGFFVTELEQAGSSKRLVFIYQTIWSHTPENSNLQSLL